MDTYTGKEIMKVKVFRGFHSRSDLEKEINSFLVPNQYSNKDRPKVKFVVQSESSFSTPDEDDYDYYYNVTISIFYE